MPLYLHSYGINLRYLGYFYSFLREPLTKAEVILEIVARCVKIELRQQLREEAEFNRIMNEYTVKKVLPPPYLRLWSSS